MKLMYFLDAPNEVCSSFILSQLKVVVKSGISEEYFSDKTSAKHTHALDHEHKTSVDAVLVCKDDVIIDIRDSANCWIRLFLSRGDAIELPADLYRKVAHASRDMCALYWINGVDSSHHKIVYRYTEPSDANDVVVYHGYRDLVCELCTQFFTSGWVTGTGGSISIRHGNRIYMTPSGVQKERIKPDELYVLDVGGNILSVPIRKPGDRPPKLSDCAPLFLHAFQQRGAGAVLHSHAYCTNLITSIFEGRSEFVVSHQEMIKGLQGFGYYDELVVPIIENTAHEHELADRLGETIARYPRTWAVLVRRHGMYVWGDSWEQAKRHGECLHYLFDIVIHMKQLGLDFSRPPIMANGRAQHSETSSSHSESPAKILSECRRSKKHFVFDIEGTTTSISFVHDVLFPYASAQVREFLSKNWTQPRIQKVAMDLLRQCQQDEIDPDWKDQLPHMSLPMATDLLLDDSSMTFMDGLVTYVQWNIEKDRKIPSLKQLQGYIWQDGYSSGNLQSHVYDDVVHAFHRICDRGDQISIYSSGSRQAQRLLFQYSSHGDLRSFISSYFDPSVVGGKREVASYQQIALSLGVNLDGFNDQHLCPELVFVTDVVEEAEAACQAGFDVLLSIRPGNAMVSSDCAFKQVSNFDSL